MSAPTFTYVQLIDPASGELVSLPGEPNDPLASWGNPAPSSKGPIVDAFGDMIDSFKDALEKIDPGGETRDDLPYVLGGLMLLVLGAIVLVKS